MFDLSDLKFQLFDADETQLSVVLDALGIAELPPLPATVTVSNRVVVIKKFHDKLRFTVERGNVINVPITSEYEEKLNQILANFQARQPEEHITVTDILHSLIYNYHLDRAHRAPIYSDMYVICAASEPGAFLVTGVDDEEGGEYTLHMRRIEVDEITSRTQLYCEVKHETVYPYSAVDFVEAISDEQRSFLKNLKFADATPRRFCRAGLVVTPQANLI